MMGARVQSHPWTETLSDVETFTDQGHTLLSLIQVVLSRQRDLSELTYDDIRSNIESNVRYLTKDEHIQLRSNDTTLGNYDTVLLTVDEGRDTAVMIKTVNLEKVITH